MAQNRDTRRTDTATCSGCAAVWTGLAKAHCSRCHLTFSGPALFDKHQRRDECIDPATITDHGMPLRLVDGIWRGPEFERDWGQAS